MAEAGDEYSNAGLGFLSFELIVVFEFIFKTGSK